MREGEGWEQVLDGVIQLENRAGRSVGTVAKCVEKLYDALLAKTNHHATDKEEVPRRASFMYRVGVGLYERHKYGMAIEVLTGAALVYEEREGKERAEGLYGCYGNINYCYSELGDRANERDFALKTIEMEKTLNIFRDQAVTQDLLEGRDSDFGWGSGTKK